MFPLAMDYERLFSSVMSQQQYRLVWLAGQVCLAVAVALLPIRLPAAMLASICLAALTSLPLFRASYSAYLTQRVRERDRTTLTLLVGVILIEISLLLLLFMYATRMQGNHDILRILLVLIANGLVFGIIRHSILLANAVQRHWSETVPD